MTLKDSYEGLKKALHDDPDYAHSWYCNIVMPICDEGVSYKIAMAASDRILKNAFDLEPSQFRSDSGGHPSL